MSTPTGMSLVCRVSRARSERVPSGRWWIPIGVLAALLVVLFPILAVIALVTPPHAFYSLLGAPSVLLGLLLTLLSPIFVRLDERYVLSVSTWEPSGWYSWMIVPPLSLLSVVYIYERHKYVGTP